MGKKAESSVTNNVDGVLKLVEKYGFVKILFSCLLMVFISYTTYLTLNPSIMFDRFAEYAEEKHRESFDQRMKASPMIQIVLDNIREETNASRVFIIEMHNGKYNSTGLSFNYGSLTYESLSDSVMSIMEDYADFTLERYPILGKVYIDNKWYGTINELAFIDRRLSLKLEANGSSYIALHIIYGMKSEVGFLCVEYNNENNVIPEHDIDTAVHKALPKLSKYLDGDNIVKK
jgi:hypothetical protein